MIAALVGLLAEKIVETRSYRQAHVGLVCVELRTASGRILSVRANEVPTCSFEAYTLEAADGICTGKDLDPNASHRSARDLEVDRIEIFRRDEWRDTEAPIDPTVGSDPMAIDAGPIGSAPSEAEPCTVVSGCALHPRDDSQPSLLVCLSDYPGLITISTDESDVAGYRKMTTSETVGTR